MSILKFVDIGWEWNNNKTSQLMYVTFKQGKQQYNWFPKWEDLSEIIGYAFATEGDFNNGRLKDYLTFICLEPIFRQLSLLKCPDIDMETAIHLNKAMASIRSKLLNKPLE